MALTQVGPEYLLQAIREDRYDRAVAYVKAGRPLEFPVAVGPDGKPKWDPAANEQPLVEACDRSTTEYALLLLKNGARADVVGHDGRTPLHAEAWTGDGRVAKELIDHGAKVNAVDSFDYTPLDILLESGCARSEILRLLIAHGAKTAGQVLASHKNAPQTADGAGYALPVVAVFGRWSDMIWLLNRGADPNCLDPDGKTTALMVVAYRGRDYPSKAAKMAEILIDRGADPNRKDPKGRTALDFAAENGALNVSQVLIRHGAKRGNGRGRK